MTGAGDVGYRMLRVPRDEDGYPTRPTEEDVNETFRRLGDDLRSGFIEYHWYNAFSVANLMSRRTRFVVACRNNGQPP